MTGQMSIFDLGAEEPERKRKPCEYSFKRYIGQRVQLDNGMYGKISTIEEYYTVIESDNGRYLIGTPTTMAPVEERPAPEPMPSCFAEYVGRCDYCAWKGYGLRREDGPDVVCEWSRPNIAMFRCENKNRWLPNTEKIPKLCGNCAHANLFHDEDAQGNELDWPEIFCTRDEGPVNRIRPYQEQSKKRAKSADAGHDNLEFASCEAGRSDGWHLRKEAEQ